MWDLWPNKYPRIRVHRPPALFFLFYFLNVTIVCPQPPSPDFFSVVVALYYSNNSKIKKGKTEAKKREKKEIREERVEKERERQKERRKIQLLFREVQNAFMAKLVSTALSQMSILTVGSSPGRGMRLNLPIAIVPLRRTDTGFQPPATYLGDEQMLRILGRGRSVPTVTELIFVRAQCNMLLWQSW